MKKGYTLIELLVIVTIIGILTVIGISSYNDFNQRRMAKKAVQDLRFYISLVASKAMNNEKDCSVGSCGGDTDGCSGELSEKTLDGWYIDFSDLPDDPPKIYGECGGTAFPTPVISLTGLSDISISLNPSPPDDRIQFYPLGEGTDLPSPLTISVDSSPVLIVDPSGNVSNL